MPAIGITGGVATGKSSFVRALLKHFPAPCFDADQCVHDLLASDTGLHAEIRAAFPALPAGDGIDRAALRQIVFRSDDARRTLESLIHPRVRTAWQPLASAARAAKTLHFFDIPLLYETGIEAEFDRVLVIACSPETQRGRMAENRGLASEVIAGIIKAQFDLLAKVARANHVVWNDGSPSALDAQARLFATYLRESYG